MNVPLQVRLLLYYPRTLDNSDQPLHSTKEVDFICQQRDKEIAEGRFSPAFGANLLPGMYSKPIHTVPKPHSENSDSLWII
jgi:hypothetical protein